MNSEQRGMLWHMSPLDILVLLKICARQGKPWTQRDIANELFIALGSVHNSLKASESLKLFMPERKTVHVKALEDALVYGAPYFVPAERGGEARGVPTAWAASPLSELLATDDPMIPVWPDPEGTVRGIALTPLHPSVPKAVKGDRLLYELLALVDSLRTGGARERSIAQKELRARLEVQ